MLKEEIVGSEECNRERGVQSLIAFLASNHSITGHKIPFACLYVEKGEHEW